jgi:phosphoribosylaminoimidazolecarboxamide formyltransferase/IMP cyclohydrolase
MGGILACNCTVDVEFATAVTDSLKRWGKEAGAGAFFLEVWLAPQFAPDAVAQITERKSWKDRVRLLKWQPHAAPAADALQLRTIPCGVLAQTPDTCGINFADWRVATRRQPTDREWSDLKLAWLCVKHLKSNAIALVRHGQLLAGGAGQTSRVVSCKLAAELACRNGHMDTADGDRSHFVAASDAFFPFADGPEMLMDAGATAIIQPGGSKRDDDTVKACDKRGVTLVITGTRHFRH